MAFTEEEEGKLRAIIAIFDGQAPSLSSDVAAKCPNGCSPILRIPTRSVPA